MLDLGPLHQKISTHIRAIIGNPSNLLCENPSSNIASLEGNEWQHPEIFKSIKNLDLPYLEELLVAFFTGADVIWTRFILEFAPGGLSMQQLLKNGTLHGCLPLMMKMKVLQGHSESLFDNNPS